MKEQGFPWNEIYDDTLLSEEERREIRFATRMLDRLRIGNINDTAEKTFDQIEEWLRSMQTNEAVASLRSLSRYIQNRFGEEVSFSDLHDHLKGEE